MAAAFDAATGDLHQPRQGAQAFPRSARLLDGASYSRVFRRNVRVGNRYWTVLAHFRKGDEARLGLAIARKRARRAVDRNRIKRIARETFRHQRSNLYGLDVVVMNRDQAAAASSAELGKSLDALWSELARKQRSHSPQAGKC